MERSAKWRIMSETSTISEDGLQVINKVPLCMQSYSWDCGLACACMVLQYLGKDSHDVYTTELESLNCGESIWTIDLAMMMKHFNVRHTFCTVTIGVDQAYSKQAFYSSKFSSDDKRVSQLFDDAATNGIVIQNKSVPREEILSHVEAGNVCIVLVDWNSLECTWCDKLRCQTRLCFPCISSCCGGYQGHYVVVCGFDRKKKKIFYKNPSYDEDLCCSRMDKFDAARRSYGTDEDILFIYKDGVP